VGAGGAEGVTLVAGNEAAAGACVEVEVAVEDDPAAGVPAFNAPAGAEGRAALLREDDARSSPSSFLGVTRARALFL
jgi:hypothetical protein